MADNRTAGWAAASPRSCPCPTTATRRGPSCASSRSSSSRPTRAAAAALRRGGAPGARGLDRRARRAAARARAPAPRRPLRARRRRAPLARRAAGRAGQIPALVQAHDDAASLEVALVENMAREDLNPVEEARAVAALVEELGLTREEVGRRVGRSRVAISNLLRLLDLPDEALALLEDGPPDRGPRPRAAARRRPRRPPPPGPRGRRGRLVGARHGGRARAARRGHAARRRPAAAPPRIPTRRPPPRRSPTPSAPRSAPTSASARAARGFKAEVAFEDLDEALALARACGRARSPDRASATMRRSRPRAPGRLAQSVRALL